MAWENAVVISLFGTAFLFAYLYNTINPDSETERPIYNVWYVAFKLLFLFGALFMAMLGTVANYPILEENGINKTTSGVATIINLSYQLQLWIIILFTFFLVIGGILAFIWKSKEVQAPKE